MSTELEERIAMAVAVIRSPARPNVAEIRPDEVDALLGLFTDTDLIKLLNERRPDLAVVVREPSEDMKRMGARSIGETMMTENHNVRSTKCYKAMLEAGEIK